MRRRRPAKAVTAVSTTDVATSVTESCGETSLSMHYLPALHCCMCLSSPLIPEHAEDMRFEGQSKRALLRKKWQLSSQRYQVAPSPTSADLRA